uniref:Uncharacterized protein n=1 Tax=Chenopodium quinoa TaxID=63459 RepID=A0A803L3V0_CHEQI
MSRHRRQASRVIPPEIMAFDSPPSDPCFLIDQITVVDGNNQKNPNRQSTATAVPATTDHQQNVGPQNVGGAPPSDGKTPAKSTT